MAQFSIDKDGLKKDDKIVYSFNDSYVSFDKADLSKPAFEKTAPDTIKVLSGLKVRVDSNDVVINDDVTLRLPDNLDEGSKTPGTDYFIYVTIDGNAYLSADMEKTVDRLVGGFHYSLVPEDEEATGNKTDDDMVILRGINGYSIWDLKWKSSAKDPRGKALTLNGWEDIYLIDVDYAIRGFSSPYALDGSVSTIAAGGTDYGRNYPKIPLAFGGDGDIDYGSFTWFEACEVVGSNEMELLSYQEIQKSAYGVVEGIGANTLNSDYDSGDNEGKIVHYPEFLSKFGLEQATSVQYIWGKDVGGARDEDSTSWAWRDLTGGRGKIDSLHDNHITASIFGGHSRYDDSGIPGSRCSGWSNCVWFSVWSRGGRGRCDHLQLV